MWTAKLKDGTSVTEGSSLLSDIRDEVVGMSFEYRGVEFRLPDGMRDYRSGGSGFALIRGPTSQAEVSSRWIQCELPNGTKVRIRFNMLEPEVTVEA